MSVTLRKGKIIFQKGKSVVGVNLKWRNWKNVEKSRIQL